MKDIIYDKTNKKIFANGDLVIGESDSQHMELLLICQPGSFKEFPNTGVGAASYLEDEDPSAFLSEVRNQFTNDGITVNKIEFLNSKLRIDANY